MAKKKGTTQPYLWKFLAPAPEQNPTKGRPSPNGVLERIKKQTDQIFLYSALEHINVFGFYFQQRHIPIFYFIEAAEEMGIDGQTCRQWRVGQWPITRVRDPRRIEGMLEIYLKVYIRLRQHSKVETFPDAMRRLKRKINELELERKISPNQISQHLRMSFRTLQDIRSKSNTYNNNRQRNCPWDLLDRLETIEEDLKEQKKSRVNRPRIQREYFTQGPQVPPEPPPGMVTIRRGQSCPKCQASWIHMYPSGENSWGYTLMTCRVCGKDNPIQKEYEEDDENNPTRFVERYAPCWNCKYPAHNLKRVGSDQDGNTNYICLVCSKINTVLKTRNRG